MNVTSESESQSTAMDANRLSAGGLISVIVLSTVIGLLIIGLIAWYVDLWDVLATTRFLDLLISAHIVQYQDMEYGGWIEGLPDQTLYFTAQEPIDWRLIAFALVLFAGYIGLKTVQFHRVLRAYGIDGSFAEHARAWIYGDGLDRVLPFNMGGLGAALALAKRGSPFDRALTAACVTQAMMVAEIVMFGFIGLLWVGWGLWLTETLWAMVVVAVAYYLIRPPRGHEREAVGRISIAAGIEAMRQLGRERPNEIVNLLALSFLAFMLMELGLYLSMEAFTTVANDFAPPVKYFFLSVIGGYICRLVPFTPGAIGQFELGFCAVFYVGGGDLSLGLFIAALVGNFFRNLTSLGMMSIVVMRYTVPTSMREVLAIARRDQPAPST